MKKATITQAVRRFVSRKKLCDFVRKYASREIIPPEPPTLRALSRRSFLGLAAGFAVATAVIQAGDASTFFLSGGGGTINAPVGGTFNAKTQFGALGDGVMLNGASMSSSSNPTHLSCSTANFTSADAGKFVCVGGAGASSAPLVTTIASIISSTIAVLNASCLTTVSAAIVHYGTDDTTAIQNAINAAGNAGGGVVLFPEAIYIINGALQNTSTQNGQLVLPLRAANGTRTLPIWLCGMSLPSTATSCCGLSSHNDPPPSSGSILFTAQSGSGTSPALIAGYLGSLPDFSNIFLAINGMTFRSAYLTASPLTMVNAQWLAYAFIDGVSCDVDATDDQQAAAQPTSGGCGIQMPDIGNGALAKLNNCSVQGYYTGVVIGEHSDVDNLGVALCYYGMQARVAEHDMRVGRAIIYRCVYSIYCAGGSVSGANKCPLIMVTYDTEHSTTGWYQTIADVLDASNAIYGKMLSYCVIKSFVGYDNADFAKSGGSNFSCTALF